MINKDNTTSLTTVKIGMYKLYLLTKSNNFKLFKVSSEEK